MSAALPPDRSRFAAAGKRVLLAVGGVVALIVVLEIGFRSYDWVAQDLPFLWDPAVAAKQTTRMCNPFLVFRGRYEDWTRRLKTPEQVITPNGRQVLRIACLGGSTTQDATAWFEERITYPTELQRLLNEALGPNSDVVVETLNCGVAGHSTQHALILLETEILPLRPDLIIVYENINDLLVNYFPGDAPAYAGKFLDLFYLPPELKPASTAWLDHSRFLTWTRDRLERIFWYPVRYTDEPMELKQAEAFRTNLRNIAAVARAHDIEVVFGQQALFADRELFEEHFRTKPFNRRVRYPRIDELARHLDAYNRIVREEALEQGTHCADPYSVLKKRRELFVDVVHLKAEGSRLVAREFARTMLDSGMFNDLVARKRGKSTTIQSRDRQGAAFPTITVAPFRSRL